MADDHTSSTAFSLRRWSHRKRAAATAGAEPAREEASVPVAPPAPVAPPPIAAVPAVQPAPAAAELPPVESLTMQSDFVPFFKPDVDPALKRAALKKLFADPHFNVMDGLDVYIDDYSKPDPISADLVRQLVQARHIFDPPQTRINEQGVVEDVPVAAVPVATPPPPQLAEPAAARPEPEAAADVAAPAQVELPLALPDASISLPPGRPKEGDVPHGGTARSAREPK